METAAEDRGTSLFRGTFSSSWLWAEHYIYQGSSQRNNKLVWDETFRIVDEMFQTVWGDNDVVEVNHIMDLTVPVSISRLPTHSLRTATNPSGCRSRSW